MGCGHSSATAEAAANSPLVNGPPKKNGGANDKLKKEKGGLDPSSKSSSTNLGGDGVRGKDLPLQPRSWSCDDDVMNVDEHEEFDPVVAVSEDRLAVSQKLREIAFFQMHTARQIAQIAAAMRETTFNAGDVIFEKDGLEDAFYMLFDATDAQKVRLVDYGDVSTTNTITNSPPPTAPTSFSNGGTTGLPHNHNLQTPNIGPKGELTGHLFFGETCLRYHNVKRRFGLVATDNIRLLQISPSEYRNLVIRQARQLESHYLRFLQKVPILTQLTEEQLQALSRSLRNAKFSDGSKIITQGSHGDTFYFIETGVVKCVQRTQKGPNEVRTEVNRYTAGDYFGEGALLQDVPRNADVIAVGEVSCLTLSRSDFIDLLGSLQKLLEHNFSARVLKGVDLLSSLTDGERSELADLLVDQVFQPGEQILQQGEVGDKFYIIKEGEVRFARDLTLQEPEGAQTNTDGNGNASSPTEASEKLLGLSSSNSLAAAAAAASAAVATASFAASVAGADPSLQATPPPIPQSAVPPAIPAPSTSDGNNEHSSSSSSTSSSSTTAAATTTVSAAGNGGRGHSGSEPQFEEVGRLFTGQYFGEGALLTDAPRRLSAFAVGTVTLLSLERKIFSTAFDQSLQDMLNRNFQKRKKEASAPIEFTDLEQIKVLGAGSYGQVLLVNNKVTGKTYALKSMSKQRVVALGQQRHVLNEKAILESTSHPFVVQLKQSYVSSEYVFVLLEAVLGGELFVYLNKAKRIKLKDAIFYMAQVVLVFEYLHSCNIIYRDLKPENLLVAANGYLKFTDFGLSKVLPKDRKTYTLCGTPAYAAPEIYNLSGHGKASDWWTLGVLTHELLSGVPPFDGDAEEIFASMQEYAGAYPNIHLPKGLSGDVGDFVLRLLNPNPNKRLGCLPRGSDARDVRMHPVFKGFGWNKLLNEQVKAPFKPTISSGFDTKNFYNPVVRGKPVQLDNVDAGSVKIAADWTFEN